MTWEERSADIEAKLQFTASMLERMPFQQSGIRGLYRRGVHRVEELADSLERHDQLLASLMQSQLRTEAALARTEAAIARTDEQLRRTDEQLRRTDEQLQRTDEKMASMLETFEKYLRSRSGNGS